MAEDPHAADRLEDALRALVARFGPDIADDPARVRALLADLLGDEGLALRSEVDAVVAVAGTSAVRDALRATTERDLQALLGEAVTLPLDDQAALAALGRWHRAGTLPDPTPGEAPVVAGALPPPTVLPPALPGTILPPADLGTLLPPPPPGAPPSPVAPGGSPGAGPARPTARGRRRVVVAAALVGVVALSGAGVLALGGGGGGDDDEGALRTAGVTTTAAPSTTSEATTTSTTEASTTTTSAPPTTAAAPAETTVAPPTTAAPPPETTAAPEPAPTTRAPRTTTTTTTPATTTTATTAPPPPPPPPPAETTTTPPPTTTTTVPPPPPPPPAPVAVGDSYDYTVQTDGVQWYQATLPVTGNDSGTFDYADQMTAPTHGSLSGGGVGPFLYQPHHNGFFTDSFTYRVRNTSTGAFSNVVRVTITVRCNTAYECWA